MDALIRNARHYPYFYEMRGEVLIKIRQAIGRSGKAYARAISLDRQKPALIRIELARALIATGDKGDLDKAVHELKTRHRPRAGELRMATASSPRHTGSSERSRLPNLPRPTCTIIPAIWNRLGSSPPAPSRR